MCECVLSHVHPLCVAHQAPLSMGFSRQEYWSRLPFPSPEYLPNQGLNQHLLHWQVDSLWLCLIKTKQNIIRDPFSTKLEDS